MNLVNIDLDELEWAISENPDYVPYWFEKWRLDSLSIEEKIEIINEIKNKNHSMKFRNLLIPYKNFEDAIGLLIKEHLMRQSQNLKFTAEKIPGGKAKNRNPKDFDPKQLKMGIEIEKKHVNDEEMAKEIVMDHLVEFPDYYTRLKKMEEKAKKESFNLRNIKLGYSAIKIEEHEKKMIDEIIFKLKGRVKKFFSDYISTISESRRQLLIYGNYGNREDRDKEIKEFIKFFEEKNSINEKSNLNVDKIILNRDGIHVTISVILSNKGGLTATYRPINHILSEENKIYALGEMIIQSDFICSSILFDDFETIHISIEHELVHALDPDIYVRHKKFLNITDQAFQKYKDIWEKLESIIYSRTTTEEEKKLADNQLEQIKLKLFEKYKEIGERFFPKKDLPRNRAYWNSSYEKNAYISSTANLIAEMAIKNEIPKSVMLEEIKHSDSDIYFWHPEIERLKRMWTEYGDEDLWKRFYSVLYSRIIDAYEKAGTNFEPKEVEWVPL